MSTYILKEDASALLKEDGDHLLWGDSDTLQLLLQRLVVSFTGVVASKQRYSQQIVEVPNEGNAGKYRISQAATEAANTGTQIQRISSVLAEAANTGTSRQRMSQFLVEVARRNVRETCTVQFVGF